MEPLLHQILLKAAGHFAAGLVLALADRLLSRPRPSSLAVRLATRLDALKLLTHLRDLETGAAEPAGAGGVPAGELPDADEIREACDYLRERLDAGEFQVGELSPSPRDGAGPVAFDTEPDDATLPRLRRQAGSGWDRLLFWLQHEKINPHSLLTKLKVGYVMEIAADLLAGLSQLVWGRGNFFPALGHSLYQGAALGIGLIVGAFFFGRRDQRAPRKLRKAVERLEKDLDRDPRALALLERIGRGELPRVALRPELDTVPSESEADHAP